MYPIDYPISPNSPNYKRKRINSNIYCIKDVEVLFFVGRLGLNWTINNIRAKGRDKLVGTLGRWDIITRFPRCADSTNNACHQVDWP